MTLDDILSLSEAADELGLGASTLRHQAAAGRLKARVVGKTWITTRQEVDRYRREDLGRSGQAKWSEIRQQKGAAAHRRTFSYTSEREGDGWILRVIGRPGLITSAPDLAQADAMVADLIATWDRRAPESFAVVRVD